MDEIAPRSRSSSFSSFEEIAPTPESSRPASPLRDLSASDATFEIIPEASSPHPQSLVDEPRDSLIDEDQPVQGNECDEDKAQGITSISSEITSEETVPDTVPPASVESADIADADVTEVITGEEVIDNHPPSPCTCYKSVIGELHGKAEKCPGKMQNGESYRDELKYLAFELKNGNPSRIMNLNDVTRFLRVSEPLSPILKRRMSSTVSTKGAVTEALEKDATGNDDHLVDPSFTSPVSSNHDAKLLTLLEEVRSEMKELRRKTVMQPNVDLSEVHDAYRLLEMDILKRVPKDHVEAECTSDQTSKEDIQSYEDRINEVKVISGVLIEHPDVDDEPKLPPEYHNPMTWWKPHNAEKELTQPFQVEHHSEGSSTEAEKMENSAASSTFDVQQENLTDKDENHKESADSTAIPDSFDILDIEVEQGVLELKILARWAQMLSETDGDAEDYGVIISELKEKIASIMHLQVVGMTPLQKELAAKDLIDLRDHYKEQLHSPMSEDAEESSNSCHCHLLLKPNNHCEETSAADKEKIAALEKQVQDLLSEKQILYEELTVQEDSQVELSVVVSEQFDEISSLREQMDEMHAISEQLDELKTERETLKHLLEEREAEVVKFANHRDGQVLMLDKKILQLIEDAEKLKKIHDHKIRLQDADIGDLIAKNSNLEKEKNRLVELNESLQADITQIYNEVAESKVTDETLHKIECHRICQIQGALGRNIEISTCGEESCKIGEKGKAVEDSASTVIQPSISHESTIEHLDRHGLLDILQEETSTLYKNSSTDTQLGLLRMFSKPLLRAQADEIIGLKREINTKAEEIKKLSSEIEQKDDEIAISKDVRQHQLARIIKLDGHNKILQAELITLQATIESQSEELTLVRESQEQIAKIMEYKETIRQQLEEKKAMEELITSLSEARIDNHTMADWDEVKEVNLSQAREIKQLCATVKDKSDEIAMLRDRIGSDDVTQASQNIVNDQSLQINALQQLNKRRESEILRQMNFIDAKIHQIQDKEGEITTLKMANHTLKSANQTLTEKVNNGQERVDHYTHVMERMKTEVMETRLFLNDVYGSTSTSPPIQLLRSEVNHLRDQLEEWENDLHEIDHPNH